MLEIELIYAQGEVGIQDFHLPNMGKINLHLLVMGIARDPWEFSEADFVIEFI
jgi:hypothetical protein